MMNAAEKTLKIEQISFESNGQDMLLRGSIQDGHLSYASEILLSIGYLNRILSEIQKNTGIENLSEAFETERMYEENVYFYSLDLRKTKGIHASLPLSYLPEQIRQIRA